MARRDRDARRRRPADLERPRRLGAAPAAGPLLLAGLRGRRDDRSGAGADGHAAGRRPGPRQARSPLRSQPRHQVLPVIGRFPGRRAGCALQAARGHSGVALGPEGAAVDERQGRCAGWLQRRRVLVLGTRRRARRPDRLPAARQGRGARSGAARGRELGGGTGLPGARRDRPRERADPRARPHGGQQAPSRALRELADDRVARRRRMVARVARQAGSASAAHARRSSARRSCTASSASTNASASPSEWR